MTGLVYGIFLYQKEKFVLDKKFIIHIIISILIVTIIINSCINSLWIILTVKTASIAIIPTRIIKNLIMIPIMFVTTFTLGKLLKTQINEVKNA